MALNSVSATLVQGCESLLYEPCPGSMHLLAVFSGWTAGFAPGRFHFRRSLQKIPVNKLYLRDCFGIWYHGGLKGLTPSISETARFLSDVIVNEGFEGVTFLGVSSGGYAALLLGKMIDVSRIRAVSPRTFLDIDNRKRHGDFRLYHATSALYAHPWSEKQYFDLRPVLVQSPGSMPPTRVFYDPFAEIDRAHVENIADVRGIELVECPDTGHWASLVLVNDRSFLADLAAPDG